MQRSCLQHWRGGRVLLSLILSLWGVLSAQATLAAEQDATLFLRPHCVLEEKADKSAQSILGPIPSTIEMMGEEEGEGGKEEEEESTPCPGFEVEDPQTLRTPVLEIGDILDIDIVISNPSKQPISRARTWLGRPLRSAERENRSSGFR